jgi:hypothetical protein
MLHDKKKSKQATTERVKQVFPNMVKMIKIEQELVIGHAMYDSEIKQVETNNSGQLLKIERLGLSGKDLAIRASQPSVIPRRVSQPKKKDLQEYVFDA